MSDQSLKPKILIVDDDPENIRILVKTLDGDYETMAATSGPDALETVFSKNRPDLILLDIMMPEMDGYEVCKRLKSHIRTRDIPVIFVTSMSEPEDEARCFKAGAEDYISKPVYPEVIKARIRIHLKHAAQILHMEHKARN